MVMRKSLKRQKAGFGVDGALMAAALGVQTAAQITQAALGRKATIQAARDQANSIDASTKANSDAMLKANQVAIDNQRKSQEFIAQQNAESRDIQKTAMTNMQMLMGQENSKQRKEQGMITAKYGSNLRRKLKQGGKTANSSTGELGFKITDGGEGVSNPIIPLEYTPDGGIIFMVNPKLKDHGEKNSDGKKGVGIATATINNPNIPKKSNLEVEGGEIGKAKFGKGIESMISKHTLPGSNFNPKDVYLATGNYDMAFNEGERIKDIKGIPDSGYAKYGLKTRLGARDERRFQDFWKGIQAIYGNVKPEDYSTDYRRLFKGNSLNMNKVRKLKLNGGTTDLQNTYYATQPELNDVTNNTFTLSAMLRQNNIPETANAANGQQNITDTSRTNVLKSKYGGRIKLKDGGSTKNKLGIPGMMGIGTGASALSSIIGGALNTVANKKAAGILSDAYSRSGQAMIDAYNQLHGIDLSTIKAEDYAATPVLANIRNARYNINPQLENIERIGRQLSKNIKRNTLSSANQQQKELALLDKIVQTEGETYGTQSNAVETIKQSNMQELNKVTNENADRELQAKAKYADSMLTGMEFNAGIDNTKALGIGEAKAGIINNIAQTRANSILANGQTWGNVANNIGTNAANYLTGLGVYRMSLNNALLAADNPEKASYLGGNKDIITRNIAEGYANEWINSNSPDLKERAKRLAEIYGFKIYRNNLGTNPLPEIDNKFSIINAPNISLKDIKSFPFKSFK